MTAFEPVSAASLAEINVTWTSRLFGTVIDPTGATAGQAALPVAMAFPASSGNPLEPAVPVTWYSASWLLGSTAAGWTCQCLVGPGSGVVTLTPGVAVDVWATIQGVPEVPAVFAGTLPVYGSPGVTMVTLTGMDGGSAVSGLYPVSVADGSAAGGASYPVTLYDGGHA